MEVREHQIEKLKGVAYQVKRFETMTFFSLKISSKVKDKNEWKSGYLKCKIKNDILKREVRDKEKIEVDGFLTGEEWTNKENKVIHEVVMWGQELRFRDDTTDGFEDIKNDEELPFK